jgi:hypothetical protein
LLAAIIEPLPISGDTKALTTNVNKPMKAAHLMRHVCLALPQKLTYAFMLHSLAQRPSNQLFRASHLDFCLTDLVTVCV